MIEVKNLTKRYGRVTAVNNLSFEVQKGEIVGFLGPNGAGKTTTMRILSSYLPATGGTVKIAGFDVFNDSFEVRKRIGYLPETVPLYSDMRVVEYLSYRARLKRMHGKHMRMRIDAVLSQCGLEDVRRTIIGHLSKGYKQRVGLADSLVHEPELLILDEPTIGLDPNQIRLIRNLIKSLSEKHTVLLSSHILSEIEMICERVMILDRGGIVTSDSTDKLLGLMKGNPHITVEIKADKDKAIDELQKIAGVIKVACESEGTWSRFVCECDKGSDVREDIFRAVKENQWSMCELSMEKQNLEDVFVEMTT